MDLKKLDDAIASLHDLVDGEERSSLERATLVDIVEDLEALGARLKRDAIPPDVARELGVDSLGRVTESTKLQDLIKGMAGSVKNARLTHRKKKEQAATELKLLRPKLKLKPRASAEKLLLELEIMRRYLIVLKKYLNEKNLDVRDGELDFTIDERDFKTVWGQVLQHMIVQGRSFKLERRFFNQRKLYRYLYHTNPGLTAVMSPEDWDTLFGNHEAEDERDAPPLGWDDIAQHTMHEDTIDYIERGEDRFLLFYPGDEREPFALSGRRVAVEGTNGTGVEHGRATRLFQLEKHTKTKKKKNIHAGQLNREDHLGKIKKKGRHAGQILAELLKIATGVPEDEKAKTTRLRRTTLTALNRTMTAKIALFRILISELIETHIRRETQSRYVGKVRALGRPVEEVVTFGADIEERWQGVKELRDELEELWLGQDSADDYVERLVDLWRELMHQDVCRARWDDYLQVLALLCEGDEEAYAAGKQVLDGAHDGIARLFEEEDGSNPRLEQAEFRLTHFLALTLCGELGAEDGLALYELMCNEPPEPPDGEEEEAEREIQRLFGGVARDRWEEMHTTLLAVLELELQQLGEIKGYIADQEEYRTAGWVQHATEISRYIRKVNGVCAFVDSYLGCFTTMRRFIEWTLFGCHKPGEEWRAEALRVGDAAIKFEVGLSLGASFYSRIEAKVAVVFTVAGTIAHEDDRRVRHRGIYSVGLKLSAGAKLTLKDIVDTEIALDLINASLAADKELAKKVRVSVYESHIHMAAVWARKLARARTLLTKAYHTLKGGEGMQLFGGVPTDEDEKTILTKVIGDDPHKALALNLLQRKRLEARSGYFLTKKGESHDWNLAFDANVPLVKYHAERFAENRTYARFSSRTYDAAHAVKGKEVWAYRRDSLAAGADEVPDKAPVVTSSWSKSILSRSGLYIMPARTPDELLKHSIEVEGGDNPLDIAPIDNDPATKTLVEGFVQHEEDMFPLSFTCITNHPNPDNDGMYFNIKASRTWSAGVGGTPEAGDVSAAFSLSRTHSKHIDPWNLRWCFNMIVQWGLDWMKKVKEGGVRGCNKPVAAPDNNLPDIEPGDVDPASPNAIHPDKDTLYNYFLRDTRELITGGSQPSLLWSEQGGDILWMLRYLALFGGFDVNYVYSNETGYQVQYGRVWINTAAALSLGYPILPFLTLSASVTASMTHTTKELLGLHTLTYIQTVYNGVQKRYEGSKDWEAFVRLHRLELLALFNWLAVPDDGSAVEVGGDTDATLGDQLTSAESGEKGTVEGNLHAAAQALLASVQVEVAAHPKALRRPPAESRARQLSIWRNLKDSRRHSSANTIVAGKKVGVYGVTLWDAVGGRYSDDFCFRYRRGAYAVLSKDAKAPKDVPVFVVQPTCPYRIIVDLRGPKYLAQLKLELLDHTGNPLGSPLTIEHDKVPLLLDKEGKKSQQRKKVKKPRFIIEWYGNQDGSLALDQGGHLSKKKEKLRWGTLSQSYQLEGCRALAPSGANFYCLRVSVAEAVVRPTYPAAWLYFVVPDDPLAKLDTYLAAKRRFQVLSQASRWHPTTPPPPTPVDTPLEERIDAIPLDTGSPPPEPSDAEPKPVEEPAPQRAAVVGIENIGNTCFINAALQLIATQDLADKAFRGEDVRAAKGALPPLAQQVLDLVDAYHQRQESGRGRALAKRHVRGIRQILQERGLVRQAGEEGDSEEALFAMLEAFDQVSPELHRARTAEDPKSQSELVEEFFEGGRWEEFRESKLYMPVLVERSFALGEPAREATEQDYEDFSELEDDGKALRYYALNRIQIGLDDLDGEGPHSLADALAAWWDRKDLPADPQNAQKWIHQGQLYLGAQLTAERWRLLAHPEYLVIALNRLGYEEGNGAAVPRLNRTPVDAPWIFEHDGVTYHLKAFIEHIPSETNPDNWTKGHYVSFIRAGHKTWWRVSDSHASLRDSESRNAARQRAYVYLYKYHRRKRRRKHHRRRKHREPRDLLPSLASLQEKWGQRLVLSKTVDLTTVRADAVVNAAKRTLQGGGGVDGAIHAAAGGPLLTEINERDWGAKRPGHDDLIADGDAIITGAHRLGENGVKHIIHAVGPRFVDGTQGEPAALRNAYANSLAFVGSHGLTSIVFPPISTGIFHYPLKDATRIALEEVEKVLTAHQDLIVVLTFFKGAFPWKEEPLHDYGG